MIIIIVFLSGCNPVNLHLAENDYQKAIDSGDLDQQITLVDELFQYDPNKYQATLIEKEYLLPLLEKLADNPRKFDDINEQDLARVIAFSPNYEPFSYIKKYLDERQAIVKAIKEGKDEAKVAKERLGEKLRHTPKHIETYDTGLSFKYLPRYFLAANYTRSLIESLSKKTLNGYQLEAVVKGLSELFIGNQKAMVAISTLDAASKSKHNDTQATLSKENGDVQRVLLWLYKKQLIQSYNEATKSNEHLLSLLNSQYGRERLDDVWLKLVEPAAKKLVMQAKNTYLNSLDLIAAKIDKTAVNKPSLKKLYRETLAIDKQLLSLMWPPNGLEHFDKSSKEVKQALTVTIKMIQQR